MGVSPKLRLADVGMFERPVRLRLPFRFGAATLREARQAFVRVVVEDAAGQRATGMAAELMVPKWFDKSPALSNADNENQLRRSLQLAARAVMAAGLDTAFGLHAAVEAEHHRLAAAQELNGLVASFGLALIDRAILDALCRLSSKPVAEAVQSNLMGLDERTASDLSGFSFSQFLEGLSPASSIAARHTVGLLDAVASSEIDKATRLDDGLPESLEEAIDVYGLTYFKVKVAGDLQADLERLRRIARLLDGKLAAYSVTLDGNEQFASAEAVAELIAGIEADEQLTRFAKAILFVEQPIARAQAFQKAVTALAAFRPVEIDESDADIDAFLVARDLGYTGISSKSCKGFYRSLINRARVAKWHAEDAKPYFMSGEDLTTQGGLAVQQDLALAALIGMTHVERNGHHYVDGMAGAPAAEQEAFLRAHGDLYQSREGRTRLAIKSGRIALGSVLGAVGLGCAVEPDWSAMDAMPQEQV